MNRIKILPDNLANQIAAGEVVERPASVIKELVENSLDAGAKRIQIDVELGGRRLMRVADDGAGMARDDAILAFERHATSKIKTLEDLSKIETLGFRGEALASIASVAKVELITKRAEEIAATRVYIEGGRFIDVKEAARSQGTTITVRDLFFNTPARRKFMRSEATENYHLTSIVTHYAMANAEIAFTLTNNGREILRVSPAKDLRERAYQIFGANLIESLLPVSGGREYVAKINGYISAPRERRTTRDAQYFFINGRFVRDKIIAGGLLEGFRSVLPHGVYPVAFLFLDIPLEEVDVNVHPAKTEVRFRRSEAVKETIAEAIRAALQKAGIVREEIFNAETQKRREDASDEIQAPTFQQTRIEFQTSNLEPETVSFENSQNEASSQNDSTNEFYGENFEPKRFENNQTFYTNDEQTSKPQNQFIAETTANDFTQVVKLDDENFAVECREPNDLTETFSEQRTTNGEQFQNNENLLSTLNSPLATPIFDSAAKIPKAVEPENLHSGKIRPVAQLHESFIIAVDDEGMLLVDQHVAHERILFDKFRKKETDRIPESQNLLLPETIDLTPAQSVAFDLIEEELENCGFALMRLSGRTVAIKSVPTDLPASEVRNLFAEILDAVEKDKRGFAKETLRDQIAASLACKAAVKINMKLTNEKMQWLIDNLLKTSSPTTCPHGRPVILRLTMKDIERGFHRS